MPTRPCHAAAEIEALKRDTRQDGWARRSAACTRASSTEPGLTLRSLTGNGDWTCDEASPSCTTAESVAGSRSFPVITLRVDVAGDAPSAARIIASATGGGEIRTPSEASIPVSLRTGWATSPPPR